MPIRPIERRLPEIGRLRLGERKQPNRPGKPLETFRFSSKSKENVEAMAELHGGDVREWAENGRAEWDVILTSPVITILVPPDNSYMWRMEQWGRGRLSKWCDGLICNVVEEGPEGKAEVERPCECDEDEPECQSTTRMRLMIDGLPVIGQVLMVTHSWNAAAEIPGLLEVIERAAQSGVIVPATLRIEQRTQVHRIHGTRHFKVPVVEPRTTFAQLVSGETGPALTDERMGEAASGQTRIAAEVTQRPALTVDPAAPEGDRTATVTVDRDGQVVDASDSAPSNEEPKTEPAAADDENAKDTLDAFRKTAADTKDPTEANKLLKFIPFDKDTQTDHWRQCFEIVGNRIKEFGNSE